MSCRVKMGIKKRICRTLMWPKDYPQIKPLKRISHREIPITIFLFGMDVLTLIGNHGPPGPATDRSESARDFQNFETPWNSHHKNLIWGHKIQSIWPVPGIHGPPGPATEWSESVRDFLNFKTLLKFPPQKSLFGRDLWTLPGIHRPHLDQSLSLKVTVTFKLGDETIVIFGWSFWVSMYKRNYDSFCIYWLIVSKFKRNHIENWVNLFSHEVWPYP